MHSPGWRMVMRRPGTLIEKFVPFTANAIGGKAAGVASHDAWLAFEAAALDDGVIVRFPGIQTTVGGGGDSTAACPLESQTTVNFIVEAKHWIGQA